MKERINPSKFVIIITLSVLLFTVYSFFAFKEIVIVSIILTLLNLFLFISYPLSIVKEPEHIIINRIKGKVIFNIEDYKIQRVDKRILKGAIRTFASGGLFGYQGYFYSNKLGHFKMIAVNLKQLYLLENKTTGEKIIINLI
ncbi:PH domain-containing protein [Tannerella forsythia]|uniref:PH domain-containing protein n=1 Tax=Tannerella forsythia TaxID=28112 RepID=UPI000764A710|nr:PH domain-containing protein [Tannerella forsythia]